MPCIICCKESVTEQDSVIFVDGTLTNDVLYGNGFTKGAFDMSNRYMAGDWRQYYFDIQNDLVDTAIIELSWESDDTNFGVFVMDPSGKIIQTNVPSGVFGHFLGWPSLDWLGNSLFSQGGGFYPVKIKIIHQQYLMFQLIKLVLIHYLHTQHYLAEILLLNQLH